MTRFCRLFIFVSFAGLIGCDDGSGRGPRQYLFITDSVGISVGDRVGYVEALRLSGVHQPEVPGFGSPEVVARIDFYKGLIVDLGIDTVWINVGLWDASDRLSPQTSFEEYASNIEFVFQEFIDSGVQVIWCETTLTTREESNEYTFELNVIADTLAMEYGIPIFEMSYLQQVRGWELSPDGVHFTSDAVELIADEIEEFLIYR
jgi:hypothetical protein